MNKHYLRESDYEDCKRLSLRMERRAQRWAVYGLLMVLVFVIFSSRVFAAPFAITTKGRYVLTCEGSAAVVSSHNVETEAYESSANYAASKGGKAKCTVTPPFKELVIDIGSAQTPVCTAPKPADESRTQSCPTGTSGQWSQARTYASAPYPGCWTAGSWLPATPAPGSCPPIVTGATANPMGIAFGNVTNVTQYAKPGGLVVAGRCASRYTAPEMQAVRAGGGEVLQYLVPTERPDVRVCAADQQFFMGDEAKVPLWPFPSAGARMNWDTTKLTDIRAGSAWANHVVAYIEGLMRERKVDGVFLDVTGSRLWSSLAKWDSWPQAEKDAWTDGNVDLVRRLDESRRRIDPNFIIVTNGVWHRSDDTRGSNAEQYIDGVNLEHFVPSSEWHRNYAARPFGNLGHRRVLVIANNRADAIEWAKVPGVTHVSDQSTSQYTNPNPPALNFRPLNDRTAPVLGSARVSWDAPTKNTDGTPLTDLQGYRLVWGPSPTAMANAVSIDNAGATSYSLSGLAAGTWYFALYARSVAGESAQSNVASKVVP